MQNQNNQMGSKEKAGKESNMGMGKNANEVAAKNKESMRDKLGDAVEKLGAKVSNSGAEKLGKKIHDLGDSIEKHHDKLNH